MEGNKNYDVFYNANIFCSDKLGNDIVNMLKIKSVSSAKYILLNNEIEKNKLTSFISESFLNFYCFDFNLDSNIKFIKNISEIIIKNNRILIGMVIIPETKSKVKLKEFQNKIIKLKEFFNTIIIVDLNQIKKLGGDFSKKQLNEIFKELFSVVIKGIIEIIVTPQLVGLDYNDVNMIFRKGKLATISFSQSNSKNRIEELVEDSFSSILLNCKLTNKSDCLIHMTGSEDLTLEKIDDLGHGISNLLPQTSNVLWGVRIEDNLLNKLNIFSIFTEVEFK